MTDGREFEQLRQHYRSLPQAEPGELVDARIRAAAREAVNRRSIAAWTGAFALAASIGSGGRKYARSGGTGVAGGGIRDSRHERTARRTDRASVPGTRIRRARGKEPHARAG